MTPISITPAAASPNSCGGIGDKPVHNEKESGPPLHGILQACARSTVGRIVGSYAAKQVAGLLMGLGIGFPPLFIAGAALFLVSTIVSTLALKEKDDASYHLFSSVVHCAIGLGFGSIAMAAPLAVYLGLPVTVGVSAAAEACDFNQPLYRNYRD